MPVIPTKARYEAATKTIRAVPENYWLASMDSWDGAVDHERTALIFAAAFELLAAAKAILSLRDNIEHETYGVQSEMAALAAAIAKAEGKS